ncbi:MAG: hypothetical protein SGPRY_011235 [Prymnesium sp.]
MSTAAFFFSLPGVEFEPCAASLVGLGPVEAAVQKARLQTAQAGEDATVEDEAADHVESSAVNAASPPAQLQEANPARGGTSEEEVAAAAEAAVLAVIERGTSGPLEG